ncbi:hypothetical protein MAC_09110 [Metarhizium acridum CQMa 102]|uniref:Rhodopsin domain-containing protein n=1 Tax=Metarhizium acridum (strain CQMa 102) TaxID=655827 RepID=E9EGW2_METAQ|nr:uncharacterized protein MAC_09110 [Metarhizium acridum CQMa 102]EFY84858.1 hypothetical protein MAC_09110 [Metarhizium acridum CQMa 102]
MSDPRIDEAIAAGHVPPDVPLDVLKESRDTPAIASIVVVAVLTSLVVMCRLYSRKYITKKYGFGIDDGIALASLLVFIPFAALCIVLINLGAARNFLFEFFVMTEDEYRKVQLMDSIAHLAYSTALVLCRVSGIAFYYRICYLDKKFLLAIKIIFVIIMLGISLVCDFLLFGIPAAMLKGLELPRKQKLQLACTLFPGILVIGISVARVVLVTDYAAETDDAFGYAFLKLLCVEVAEVGATIIAVSVPGVKPMVDKYILTKDKESHSSSSNSRGSSMSSRDEIKPHRGQVHIVELSKEKGGR